ncbi:NADP-dependent oxidoreductase domain-containing protein [Dichotomocladium elegans]|nr:NADP-dependent oxidoreductase domain-containing protein [Dichotomocladium elegans]
MAALDKVYELNTGAKIPAIGLGTWQGTGEEAYAAVKTAIAAGYRHIDTAFGYGNETEVGNAIRDSMKELGLKREDIFVTTKLWPTYFRPERVAEGFNASYERLNIGYIDLFLAHWPIALSPEQGVAIPRRPDGTRELDNVDPCDTWAAMEKLLDTGKVKAIGVSNYSIPFLTKLLETAKIVPAVNQIELHPYLPQQRLVDFCASKGIHTTAYSPLGSSNAPLLQDETINKIAAKHNKSPAQVVLSWGIARSSILPKSVKPERVKANADLFELSAEEKAEISELHKTKGSRFIKPDWGTKVFDEDFD